MSNRKCLSIFIHEALEGDGKGDWWLGEQAVSDNQVVQTVGLVSPDYLCCAFRTMPSHLHCVLCIINAVIRALICMLWKRPDLHRLISTQPCLLSDVTQQCSEWCWMEQAQLEDSRLSGTRKTTPVVSFKLRGFVYIFSAPLTESVNFRFSLKLNKCQEQMLGLFYFIQPVQGMWTWRDQCQLRERSVWYNFSC